MKQRNPPKCIKTKRRCSTCQLALISPRATEGRESIAISITFLLHSYLSLLIFLSPFTPSALDTPSQTTREPGLSLRHQRGWSFSRSFSCSLQHRQSKLQTIQALESYRPLKVTRAWSLPRGSSSQKQSHLFQ